MSGLEPEPNSAAGHATGALRAPDPITRLPALTQVVIWAVAAVTLVGGITVAQAVRAGGAETLLLPGELAPATEAVLEDIPDAAILDDRVGFDGAIYYAIARSIPDLDRAVPYIGLRPAYRFQRIGLPALSRVLHPQGGGGTSLVWALFAANLLGIGVGAVALGALATQRGGPAWAGALYPLAPCALMPLLSTLPEAAAAGFGIGAVALSERRHLVGACLLALAAVLTKETTVVLLLGVALGGMVRQRSWAMAVPAGIGGLAGAGWILALRDRYPSDALTGSELGLPFRGIITAIDETARGRPGASWIAVGYTLLIVVGLIATIIWGDRRSWIPIAAGVALLFQSTLGPLFVHKTMNALRFSAPSVTVLILAASTSGFVRRRAAADGRPAPFPVPAA